MVVSVSPTPFFCIIITSGDCILYVFYKPVVSTGLLPGIGKSEQISIKEKFNIFFGFNIL